jgi:hypothetical protein
VTTNGIQAIYLETHNWGKAAKFFQSLGFELEFETDHSSGQLRNGNSPYVFIAEIPTDQSPQIQVTLGVSAVDGFDPGPGVEVVTPFDDTHWGTKLMKVRDPDGRLWSIEGPRSG